MSSGPPGPLGQVHAGHRTTTVHIASLHPDRVDGGWALKLGQVGAHPNHLTGHPLHYYVDVGDRHGSCWLASEGDRAVHNDLKQLT